MERDKRQKREQKRRSILNISIKYKIVGLVLFTAVISMVIFSVLFSYMYSNAIARRSEKHIQENVRIMTDRIDAVVEDGNLCGSYLLLNISQIESTRDTSRYSYRNRIDNLLNQSQLLFKGVDSIVFIDRDNQIHATDERMEIEKSEDILSSEYLKQIQGTDGSGIVLNRQGDCMDRSAPVVTIGKNLIHGLGEETLGYVFINLNLNYLQSSVQNAISYYLIYDELGNCMSDIQGEAMVDDVSARQILYEGDQSRYSYGKDEYLIARSSIRRYGWTIIGITNLNEFDLTRTEFTGIVLVTCSVLLLFTLLTLVMASKLITQPLIHLKNGAKQIATGDFEVEFAGKTSDEIGELESILNAMTRAIRHLFLKVDEEAKAKRKYELALIQEQVKPHFLYNTLDVISVLIEMKRAKDAQRVTKKLADFYRRSLSNSGEVISLDEELRLSEDYMDLQNMRYGDKFTYQLDVDADLLENTIPKMTLQPLIENAIYHGLKYKEEWGTIEIAIKRQDPENISIAVSDDGIGMDGKRLALVKKLLNHPEEHFGLYSVNHRLKLFYGDTYGLTVESEPQIGTRIQIRIPANTNGGDHD